MQNRILTLLQERNKLIIAAREMLEAAADRGEPLSGDDEAKYKAMIAKAQGLKDLAEELRTTQALDAAGEQTAETIARQTPTTESQAHAEARVAGLFRDQGLEALNTQERTLLEAVQLRAWDSFCRHGYDSLASSQLYQAVLQITDVTKGGYLQPPTVWVNAVLQAADDIMHMRRMATVYQLATAESLGVVSLDTDPDDFSWTTEIPTSVTEDTAIRFGGRELVPNPMAKLVKASKTLLRKAPSAATIMQNRVAYKYALTMEKGCLTGTGVKQPLGVFTASDLGITTARDVSTGATTTATTFDHLKSVRGTLKQQYRRSPKCGWLLHRDGVTAVSKLKDGEGRYLWEQSNQIGDPDRLLGFPVLESENVPNTWTTGLYVGLFGDFQYYWIVEALDMQVQRLVELYAATRQDGFIMEAEADGQPIMAEAFVRMKLA